MAQEVAIGKRLKISKAQQNTLIAVLIASLTLGIGIVLSIWLIKYITFNTKVIDAKNVAISEYSQVIKEVGICSAPSAKTGVYSDGELDKCVPNDVEPGEDTLRYKILVDMAKNEDLEAVARNSVTACYGYDGEKMKYDYMYDKYKQSNTKEDRDYWLATLKACSALRVIPDALPASGNVEALLASLNQLFIFSGWQPESLSPANREVDINSELMIDGLQYIPVSLSLKTDSRTTIGVLNEIERSIREFAFNKATIKWGGEGTLELEANAAAYYIDHLKVEELKKEVKSSTSSASAKGGNKK